MFDKNLCDFLIEIARQASELALSVQAAMITPTTVEKKDKSPVTVGDLSIQALVSRRLAEQYPNDELVGEESSDVFSGEEGRFLQNQVCGFVKQFEPSETPESIASWIERGNSDGKSRRYWVLDPIDGTKGFLRHEQYAFALGLIEDGVPVLGVLGCLHLTRGFEPEVGGPGSILFAQRGEGAYVLERNGGTAERIYSSKVSNSAQARVLRSVEAGHTNAGHLEQIVEYLKIQANPVLMDSQAKYACLASGHAEVLLRLISAKMPDYKEKIWDQAAGSVVLQEAGGKITDLDGKPLDFSHGRTLRENRGICATNGLIHDEIIEAIAHVGA